MRKLLCVSRGVRLVVVAAATLPVVAFAVTTSAKDDFRVATPSLVATLHANRNYCPVIEGVGANGRFGILLQTKIWYHGRTGNARRFYEDQDEFSWPTRSCEASDAGAVVTTGTSAWDIA